jgi:alkylated DNA repair dioxygenase AlkB
MNKKTLGLQNSFIEYYPEFYSSSKASELFNILRKEIAWKQEQVKVFGKWYLQPRLTAFYSINTTNYSYSSLKLKPLPFSDELLHIKKNIEKHTTLKFTSCLANLYRNGKDSNGWHADDEKELGKNPAIASLSLGEARYFKLRNKENHTLKEKILLEGGSLLIMKGETQHYWQHQIPKTQKEVGERINLTFRILPA